MAHFLLHGTLHVTIFEVDRLHTTLGRDIFNTVQILIPTFPISRFLYLFCELLPFTIDIQLRSIYDFTHNGSTKNRRHNKASESMCRTQNRNATLFLVWFELTLQMNYSLTSSLRI